MLEFLIILLIGLLSGIVIGLMPGLPAYIGPLFLYPFISYLSVDQILAFWLSSHIGSQYFGSVAAILLKIPGEVSSMIYIKDIDRLTTTERLGLVSQTAWGSTIGSLVSLMIILLVYYLGLYTELIQLSSNNIKILLLTILVATLCWFTDHKKLSFLLFFIGFFFSEKTNHELPIWVFKIQEYTTDITIFSLILAFLIIPEVIEEISKDHTIDQLDITKKTVKSKLDFSSILRGTWLGSVIGLIPGPSHILASIGAYNSYDKDQIKEKIISAESANNSATITSLLPFLYVGLPITLNEFLLNDLLQVKLFMIPRDFLQAWPPMPSINLVEFCFIVIVLSIFVYHFLAQMFLGYYEKFLKDMHGRLKWIFVCLISFLMYIDITYNSMYVIPYIISLTLLVGVGWWMKRNCINVLPLLFGFILGDMICWSAYQFYQIYFY
jgi:TctA family transporter